MAKKGVPVPVDVHAAFKRWADDECLQLQDAVGGVLLAFLASKAEDKARVWGEGKRLLHQLRTTPEGFDARLISSDASRNSLAEVAEGKPVRIRKVRSS